MIDNSIDAFLASEASGENGKEQRIVVNWSNDSVGTGDRTVEVSDNACGMTLEQLQNAVTAGYTSNDPINHLGLFGMGFNIATARLGEVTTIRSTCAGDTQWVELTIDFGELIKARRFLAPVRMLPKDNPLESGTKIIISQLKAGISDTMIAKESDIRRQLESIYTPLLTTKDIMVLVKGRQLSPRNHCVWSDARYVVHNQANVPARVDIDRDLGHSLFDTEKNCYLTEDEAEPYYTAQSTGETLPGNIVERNKRLTGWLGIQRYADPNDYGIDFVRNGRKIRIADKSLFFYDNPFTGAKELQYPVELGSTIGGRIVGELHVDYLLPVYQKNDFNKEDTSWAQTVEAICGVGPFLPQRRKALGFPPEVTSPLGVLANAYRRVDSGTKCLFAPNDKAKEYAGYFRSGRREYIDDSLWWKAAQEEDQKRSTGGTRLTTAVNPGDAPSDDPSSYLRGSMGSTIGSGSTPSIPTVPSPPLVPVVTSPAMATSKLDELIRNSAQVGQLTGKYSFGRAAPLNVRAYELKIGTEILANGERKPCFFSSSGIDCTFVYDPAHPVLAQFPISPKELLLQYLAEKLKARDNLADVVEVFSTLVQNTMPEAKIDRQSLQDRAAKAFATLREKMVDALRPQAISVLQCIHESTGDVEDTVNRMLFNPALIQRFQTCQESGYDALEYVPEKALLRLVDRFPERVFDGKVVTAPYTSISFSDEKATERSRNESKERVMSFLKDALRVMANTGFGQRDLKNELSRASLSIDFLLGELV
ncbi:MAG: ATP-binding protein [Selenomonadales bacterium]|nr:ATP-binding protein [Selenomonadales bacterium]